MSQKRHQVLFKNMYTEKPLFGLSVSGTSQQTQSLSNASHSHSHRAANGVCVIMKVCVRECVHVYECLCVREELSRVCAQNESVVSWKVSHGRCDKVDGTAASKINWPKPEGKKKLLLGWGWAGGHCVALSTKAQPQQLSNTWPRYCTVFIYKYIYIKHVFTGHTYRTTYISLYIHRIHIYDRVLLWTNYCTDKHVFQPINM